MSFDVVLVHYGDPEATRSAVRRLSGVGASSVCVVDNHGNLAGRLPAGARVVAPGRNLGFGAGVNLGAREGRAPWLVVLNPDVTMDPAAVRELVTVAARAPHIAVLGPRLEHADGAPQINGGAFSGWMRELSRVTGLGARLRALRAAARRESRARGHDEPRVLARDWVSGAAIAIRRDAFEAAGGFDEEFFLYYEDEDLCRRLAAHGWRCGVDSATAARHSVGGSSTARDPYRTGTFEASRERYHALHSGPALAALVRFDAGRRRARYEGGQQGDDARRRVLVVAPRTPRADGKGDQVRLAQYLPRLAAEHAVTVLQPRETSGGKDAGVSLGEADTKTSSGPFDARTVAITITRVERLAGALVAWLLGRPGQAGWFMPHRFAAAVRREARRHDTIVFVTARAYVPVDDRLCTIDHVDALSLNASRRAAGQPHAGLRWLWRLEARRLARWERRIAACATAQVVTSPVDAAALPAAPAPTVVPNGVSVSPRALTSADEPRDVDLILTGNMRYPPNRDAAQWLAGEIAPRLRARRPHVRVVIAGRGADSLRLGGADVEVHSDVPDLAAWLRRAKVAAAPLRTGTGVPNKVLEAGGAGAALVLTPAANAALVLAPDAVALADDAWSFAEEVERLLSDDELRQRRVGAIQRELARFRVDDVAMRIERALVPPQETGIGATPPVGEPQAAPRGQTSVGDPTAAGELPGAAHEARRLGTVTLVGAALNAGKFVLAAGLLATQQLDLLTVGLLVAVTAAQVAGEAIALHAVTRPARRCKVDAADALAVGLAGLFVAAALAPQAVLAALAPGLEPPAGPELLALRLCCLAGAGSVTLWWAAGIAQRRFDLRGVQAITLVPNAAIVLGLALPIGDRLTAVAVTLLAGTLVATGWLVRELRRSDAISRALGTGLTFSGAATPDLRVPTGSQTRLWLGSAPALLVLLGFMAASQLNMFGVRFLSSLLPAGSLSTIYVAAGIALVPTMAAGTSVGAVLLPRWAARARAPGPLPAAGAAAAVAGLMAGALLLAAALSQGASWVGAVIDSRLLEGLRTALPILLAAVPLHAAAAVLRNHLLARGRTPLLTALALAGAALVPLTFGLSPTLAGACLGYALSAAPVVAGGVVVCLCTDAPARSRLALA